MDMCNNVSLILRRHNFAVHKCLDMCSLFLDLDKSLKWKIDKLIDYIVRLLQLMFFAKTDVYAW